MHDYFIDPARTDFVAARMLETAARLGFWGVNAERDAGRAEAWENDRRESGQKPFAYEVKNGTAIIPVRGSLAGAQIPNWYWHGDISYESIAATVEKAGEDPSVSNILMSYYSPGGTVVGIAEAAARMNAVSQVKPMVAHCQMAASAAYWVAATCNRIVVDPVGVVGSIGTIGMHADISGLLEMLGIDITLIFAGKHKADGWPFEALSDQARERWQGDVDYMRGQFVDAVAELRGMDRDAVAGTEALTYLGQLGVEAGLADDVMFYGDLLKAMAAPDTAYVFA